MTMKDRIKYLERKIEILECEIENLMHDVSRLERKFEALDYRVNDPIGSRSRLSLNPETFGR